jgi:hypothetical protein
VEITTKHYCPQVFAAGVHSVHNFGFPMRVASNVVTFRQTLEMATAMFAETSVNTQHDAAHTRKPKLCTAKYVWPHLSIFLVFTVERTVNLEVDFSSGMLRRVVS